MDWIIMVMSLVILIELVLCIALIMVMLRVMKGIAVNVTVAQAATVPPEAPDIAAVQAALDDLEKERRKNEEQLGDLVGAINDLMTGGNPNA